MSFLKNLAASLGLFACMTAVATANPFSARAYKAYEGYFAAEHVSLLCFRNEDGFAGDVELKGNYYPMRAYLVDGKLQGQFQVGSDSFDFSATVTGDKLSFSNDQWTGELQRRSLPSLVGAWRGESTTISIENEDLSYLGTITLGDSRYSFAARFSGGALSGKFQDAHTKVPFELRRRKDHLLFVTGDYREQLVPASKVSTGTVQLKNWTDPDGRSLPLMEVAYRFDIFSGEPLVKRIFYYENDSDEAMISNVKLRARVLCNNEKQDAYFVINEYPAAPDERAFDLPGVMNWGSGSADWKPGDSSVFVTRSGGPVSAAEAEQIFRTGFELVDLQVVKIKFRK